MILIKMHNYLKPENINNLTRELQQTDWSSVIQCDNVNKSYNKFVYIFLDKLKKCCPKEYKRKGRKSETIIRGWQQAF